MSEVSTEIANIALKIVEASEREGITVRVMGAVAIGLHLGRWRKFWEGPLDRKITDIDLAAFDRQRASIEDLLANTFHYQLLKPSLTPGLLTGRIIWWDSSENSIRMPDGKPLHGDVFLDRLSMNHVIEWKDRLNADSPTIPLAELVIEKTQIVGGQKRLGMGEKDCKDLTCILLEHEVGDNDKETINSEVISKTLARDWGFYYTVTTNLKKLRDEVLPKYKLSKEDQEVVVSRVNKLLDIIEKTPKTLGWKLRAKVATKKIWYSPVEELERMEGADAAFLK